jgi:hypothetical protein
MSQSLRQQLIEARGTLTRQIEIMRHPVSLAPYGPSLSFPPDNRELIAKLEAELAQVNALLADEDQKKA